MPGKLRKQAGGLAEAAQSEIAGLVAGSISPPGSVSNITRFISQVENGFLAAFQPKSWAANGPPELGLEPAAVSLSICCLYYEPELYRLLFGRRKKKKKKNECGFAFERANRVTGLVVERNGTQHPRCGSERRLFCVGTTAAGWETGHDGRRRCPVSICWVRFPDQGL